MPEPRDKISKTLIAHGQGDQAAAASLLPLMYSELKALAGYYMRSERPEHTLQPTALVHEAYLRLVNVEKVDRGNRTRFFALAARQMRRVLVDHARERNARKRRGGYEHVTLDGSAILASGEPLDLLALNEALEQLTALHTRQAHVVELRCFGGLDVKETAFVLRVSERTVKKDWRMARAWLLNVLGKD